jgi:hypothetical protein
MIVPLAIRMMIYRLRVWWLRRRMIRFLLSVEKSDPGALDRAAEWAAAARATGLMR